MSATQRKNNLSLDAPEDDVLMIVGIESAQSLTENKPSISKSNSIRASRRSTDPWSKLDADNRRLEKIPLVEARVQIFTELLNLIDT